MGGVSVNASGFSREGQQRCLEHGLPRRLCSRLGSDQCQRGHGSNNTHVVDNIGGNRDYVLLEFYTSVVVNQAYLDYVYNGDSDMSVMDRDETGRSQHLERRLPGQPRNPGRQRHDPHLHHAGRTSRRQ